jgi:hypothetical protein
MLVLKLSFLLLETCMDGTSNEAREIERQGSNQ